MAAGANSSPAISNNPSAQPHSAASNQQLFSSNSPVRAFITAISDNIRPWLEVADLSAFSKPESLSEATLRLRMNYNYFGANYLTIITTVLIFSLVINPFSLILLFCLLAAWFFLLSSNPPIVCFGRQFSDRETLVFLIILTFLVIFLTSVRCVLASALMIGVIIVAMHGAFRVPED